MQVQILNIGCICSFCLLLSFGNYHFASFCSNLLSTALQIVQGMRKLNIEWRFGLTKVSSKMHFNERCYHSIWLENLAQYRLVKDHLYFDLDQRSRSFVVKIKITYKRSRSLTMIYQIKDQDQRSNHKTIYSRHLEFYSK